MGNNWGTFNVIGAHWGTSYHVPDPDGMKVPRPPPITHDPLEGFPNGRKPRVMLATKAEMQSARIPLEHRDYCAHKLIAF